MSSTCRRNTREFTFVLPPLHRPFYYYLFMLCCLASLVTPNIAELLEASAKTAQGCSSTERDALLAFKSNIMDPSNRLESWNSLHDCCGWSGVVCRNDTTTTRIHVVELNLANPDIYDEETALQGDKLSSSLLSLTHLESLNLGGNDFNGAHIPEFIGLFRKLKYLDLQGFNFSGVIPPQLENLSSLRYLDLSAEYPEGGLRVQSLDWLMRLPALTYLDMSYVNLSVVSDSWFSTVNMLLSLQELRLFNCGLQQIPSSVSHLNLTSLATLDLGFNNFNSTLPSWLWQLTTLSYLDLYSSSFHGTIPAGIGNLSSLTELNLRYCSLLGPLPNEIWSLTHLTKLDLSFNLIGGPIPVGIKNLISLEKLFLFKCSLSGLVPIEIGKLFNLTMLYLTFNSLEGAISQLFFENLTNLQYLDLSHNPLLTIVIDNNWTPPFQLQFLALETLKLGPTIPMWLRLQNSIRVLSLYNTSIEGNLPSWFWTSFPRFTQVDLSYNQINDTLPLTLESHTNLTILNLCSNLLKGSIPKLPANIQAVDLSINSLSGPLPLNFPSTYYNLAYNQIHGRIPISICNSTQLEVLDLSHNQIFGDIPHCEWQRLNYLSTIRLGNNNLTGEIPNSIGQLKNIKLLHLNNNNLYGQIPSSFQNCITLQVLNVGNNKLSGNIPTWIGQNLQQLAILRLRSNMFSGDIPLHIGQLSDLQIIDLANNYLTGSIPRSLGNLSAIISTSKNMSYVSFKKLIGIVEFREESDNITIVTKGFEYSFSKTLSLVKIIDLSNNHLVGEIPEEFGLLAGLQTLNLSRNYLNGNIPSTVGGMKSLETLDLSYNTLSRVISQGLSALNSLSHLNLSYNNLSGMIPYGYQLQTLEDPSIYKGNANLCGALINNSCFGDKNSSIINDEQGGSSLMLSKYLSTALGFLLGLWCVFVILLFKKDWRKFYFSAIDKICCEAYVSIKACKAYVSIKTRLNR